MIYVLKADLLAFTKSGHLSFYVTVGVVDVSGHRYQHDPLRGIKRFVKMTSIPNLEKCFQDTKKKGHRLPILNMVMTIGKI